MNIDALLAGIDLLDYPRALLLDRYLASHLYRLESQFRTAPQANPQPKHMTLKELERARDYAIARFGIVWDW